MLEWNVVVSVYEDQYRRARDVLSAFGEVAPTEFYNVLVMRVEDRESFLARFAEVSQAAPGFLEVVSRVMPASAVFEFQTPGAFEAKAKEVVLSWLPRLAGKAFYVRMHRRGFKGRLSSQEEERFLDDVLLSPLEKAGTPGRIDFDDPDVVIDVETVGQRAGLSLWTRDELERYPFLKLD